MIIMFGISTFLLIVVSSIVPRRAVLSAFELERRRAAGNESAADELKREMLIGDILSIKRVIEALLLIISVLCATGAFGIIFGPIAGLMVALFYGRLGALEIIHTGAERFYERFEPQIISYIDRYPLIIKLFHSVSPADNPTEVSSREELEHLVEESGRILTIDERKRIINGLHFSEKTVERIMTPRSVIDTIESHELVGPLMLDELHRTGHSRFPVIDGDIDHVVGILHIKELLALGTKESKTAAGAMEHKVYYINQDQTLDHALAAFIKTRHHMFIVVNGYRETAGVVTLEDVMEALLGREIVDEYDVHDDLRIVAERNARENNNPPHATNV